MLRYRLEEKEEEIKGISLNQLFLLMLEMIWSSLVKKSLALFNASSNLKIMMRQ